MKKLLIANRGEIAARIMSTAHRMGLQTVAVYSDADRHMPYVFMANEAVFIGEGPSKDSYLNIQKIIAAAQETGADSIHPGYGFLSERAAFARAVRAAGLTFVGPSASAIEKMGDKIVAKQTVGAIGVPLLSADTGAVDDINQAKKIAQKLGYPILIKAAAGGGGKGMRIVRSDDEIAQAMESAQNEARTAFGDPAVFIEKYVEKARHIEIQVLADEHGNVVHLFERECSLQRRHQKVIEEAPSIAVSEALRKEMGDAAVSIAKACDYSNAGTVEFLLDASGQFYFLEMNTRLQVEHRVTECIVGMDIVEQQLRVARGEKLAFTQDDLSIMGHAIQLRVYAEDPLDNFLPSIGKLTRYQAPKGNNVWVDDSYREGLSIPLYYDSMIAKLIVYGETREGAIEELRQAINAYHIEGVETTLTFGRYICQEPHFINGDFDTQYIANHFSTEAVNEQQKPIRQAAAALFKQLYENERNKVRLRSS